MASEKDVAQLYVAMFGRAPDAEGLRYWAGLLDGGQSISQVADVMFGTEPARKYFPANSLNAVIVQSFYYNVLGRQPDSEGLNYWSIKMLGANPGSVIAEMIRVVSGYAGADPDGIQSAALFNNRVAAAEYYAAHGGSITNSEFVLRDVTAESKTVVDARVFHPVFAPDGNGDASGFADIGIDSVGRNIHLKNVQPGATLTINHGSSVYRIEVSLAGPSGTDDSLTVHLPNDTYNWTNLKLDGVEHLKLLSPAGGRLWWADNVYLGSSLLKSVALVGGRSTALYEVNADLIDFREATGDASSALRLGSRVLGSSGKDDLLGFGAGGTIEGGAGDDTLSASGPVTLLGGAGADIFSMTPLLGIPIIGDFEVGKDSLDLYSLVTNHSFPVIGVKSNYGTWYRDPVTLAPGASLQAYLHAAGDVVPHPSYAAITWFRYQGDTYVVVDNSWQSGFEQGVDQVVRLVGSLDLSALQYDTEFGTLR